MAINRSLEKRVQAVVNERCSPVTNIFYDYALGTRLGILWVNPQSDWIACRFNDVEKAHGEYDCNPFNGKCNFHGDSCVEDFTNFVEEIKGQKIKLSPGFMRKRLG